MRVSIFPENGEWLLVLNHAVESHVPAEVDATSAVSSFDKCWDGDDWTEMPANGQRFESKIKAAEYLKDHWQRMENVAEALHDPIPAPSELPIRSL
jgi:hypothetical protein